MKKILIAALLFSLILPCACKQPSTPPNESVTESEIVSESLQESEEIIPPTPLSSECTYLCSVPYAILLPAYKITQGGTTDGVYYYQDFHKNDYDSNQEKNTNYIVKYNIETGEKVLRSEPLHLNHANDMTLNPNTGFLYVAHNQPNAKRISVIETEALTVIDTFDIEYSIFSLDYNASRNQYIVGLSGGQQFMILDDQFKAASPAFEPCPYTASYTTQGAACDDDFIYFVLYKKGITTGFIPLPNQSLHPFQRTSEQKDRESG